MRKHSSILIPAVILVLLVAATGITLPRLSAEQAIPCKNCHINPGGGGARTEFGNYAVAFQELCIPQTKKYVEKKYRQPRIGEVLIVGFDSRHLIIDDPRIFRMQSDVYLTFEPFHNFMYHTRISESGVDEHYALLYFGDQKHYIKAGRFYPAFGLRPDDHTAYVRAKTGLTPRLFLDGLSVGMDIKGFNLSFEGYEPNGQGLYHAHLMKSLYIAPFGFFAGGSIRQADKIEGSYGQFPPAYAAFGAVNYDRFTLSGEVDLVGHACDTLISYSALNIQLQPGVELVTEYNFFDGDRTYQTGTEQFFRFSLEVYPLPFVQFRPSFTLNTEGPLKDTEEFFVQFHVGY